MSIQYLLMANYKLYQKLLMRELEGSGLTAGQPKILDYLSEHDGAGQREIAAACHIEAASLSSTLNGMETKGIIERRRRGNDRRSYGVFMTEKGKSLCRRVEDTFARLEIELLSGIPNVEKAELEALLENIQASMERMAD